jgi:hypothetical protein
MKLKPANNPEAHPVEITLTVSDDLAARLRPVQDQLPELLELGLREWHAAGQPGFTGLAEVLETLAALPTPQEVLALRPSPALQERIDALLEKNQQSGLDPDEQREWERYRFAEHLVRLAKARAALKLKASWGGGLAVESRMTADNVRREPSVEEAVEKRPPSVHALG